MNTTSEYAKEIVENCQDGEVSELTKILFMTLNTGEGEKTIKTISEYHNKASKSLPLMAQDEIDTILEEIESST